MIKNSNEKLKDDKCSRNELYYKWKTYLDKSDNMTEGFMIKNMIQNKNNLDTNKECCRYIEKAENSPTNTMHVLIPMHTKNNETINSNVVKSSNLINKNLSPNHINEKNITKNNQFNFNSNLDSLNNFKTDADNKTTINLLNKQAIKELNNIKRIETYANGEINKKKKKN